MQKEKYTKINKKKTLLTVVFILMVGFGLGKGEKAKAWDDCKITCEGKEETSGEDALFTTAEQCVSWCKRIKPSFCPNTIKIGYRCYFKDGIIDEIFGGDDAQIEVSENISKEMQEKNDVCHGVNLSSGLESWFNCFLLYILKFCVIILSLSATLFTWIINPDNILSVIDNKVVYDSWMMIRDVLNVFFIMFLLFSAFATVFQVDKYNYKNTLLNIVLMALLVNFSFPISRFIIDISNMIFYYFIDVLLVRNQPASGIWLVNLADSARIGSLLGKTSVGSDSSYLLAVTVLVFILAITFLVIAVLFVIRIIALAILVIFSSLAFIGAAIPPLSGYSREWWNKLFSYAFFAPIMLFMLYIATAMMTKMGSLGNAEMTKVAQNYSTNSSIIGDFSFYIIPVVILWMGLGIAQSMSIAGASAIVGKAQGFMKGTGKWSLRNLTGYNLAKFAANQTGVPGGIKQRYALWKKQGWTGSDAREEREAKHGGMFGGDKIAYQELMSKRVSEAAKKHDTANMEVGDLQNLSKTGNKLEKAAAIQELANRGKATAKQLQEVGESFGETSQVFNQLVAKIKTYDPVAAFSTALDATTGKVTAFNENKLKEHINSNQFDAKKINANSLGNDKFLETAFNEDAISHDDLEELRKKSPDHRNAISSSIKKIASDTKYGNLDTLQTKSKNMSLTQEERDAAEKQLRIAKNIHISHLAQTGELNANIKTTAAKDSRSIIFKGLNQNTAKRINFTTAKDYDEELIGNLNSGKYKAIIQAMDEDPAAQAYLNNYARTTTTNPYNITSDPAKHKTFERNHKKAKDDADLMHI